MRLHDLYLVIKYAIRNNLADILSVDWNKNCLPELSVKLFGNSSGWPAFLALRSGSSEDSKCHLVTPPKKRKIGKRFTKSINHYVSLKQVFFQRIKKYAILNKIKLMHFLNI